MQFPEAAAYCPLAEICSGTFVLWSSTDDLAIVTIPMNGEPLEPWQQLCELALRGRGLQERHLELARLISDDNPASRLQVLQYLRGGSDVEPTVWLRRLIALLRANSAVSRA